MLYLFDMPINFCRDQYIDRAANISGVVTGMRSFFFLFGIKSYSYAFPNVVVQDSVQLKTKCPNALNIAREVIVFVQSSSNRLRRFSQLQNKGKTKNEIFVRFAQLDGQLDLFL